ncbi:MAG: YceK/YidQ family lipoprotein [Verrucomicrobia bacterium]|nr:MAG: YceK/YidQ family lipoprotein [Verrucomicrobiota bacterium]
MCCIGPIGFLDLPLAVVLDTILLPYDMHMMKVERNKDSSMGNAPISIFNQAPEDTTSKVAKPRH